MNLNRQQRRALAKIGGKTGPLTHAAGQIQQAVTALKSVEGLNGMPEQIQEACRLMAEAHATVMALVEDCQGMSDETEALKAMLFEIVGTDAEARFQEHLAQVQARRATDNPGKM